MKSCLKVLCLPYYHKKMAGKFDAAAGESFGLSWTIMSWILSGMEHLIGDLAIHQLISINLYMLLSIKMLQFSGKNNGFTFLHIMVYNTVWVLLGFMSLFFLIGWVYLYQMQYICYPHGTCPQIQMWPKHWYGVIVCTSMDTYVHWFQPNPSSRPAHCTVSDSWMMCNLTATKIRNFVVDLMSTLLFLKMLLRVKGLVEPHT